MVIVLLLRLQNNAKEQPRISRSLKFLTIVLQKTNKISSNKLSITGLLSQLFQSSEISLFTRLESIKFTQTPRSSALGMLSKLLDGMFEMERTVGLLRTLGVRIGEKKV